jgi:hypothetical protein
VSYTIVRTDGTVLTTIPDGIVNTTSTPLSLPGRNYPGYGQVMDTNFVRSLENFADSTLPANAIRGQLFFDTTDDTMYICPSDGESNLSNWYRVLSAPLVNLELTDLDASGDITANNAYIDNDVTANHIITDYLTVNVNANITEANIATVAYIGEANTRSITTGTRPTLGNMIGAWTVNGIGTINGVSNTSLWVTGGNLVVTGPGTVGIRTNNYMWANGVAVSFDGTYTNTNVALYMPTYAGNVSFPNSGTAFNGNVLSAGSSATNGTIVGNWTLSPGSSLNGIPAIDGANVTGTVGNALIAQFANTAGVANTVSVNAQPNITSLGTLTSLGVNGNITAANITANTGIFAGNAAGLYNIPIANLVGTFPTVDNASNASQADIANTVRVNAQPNITSVGTLTGLIVSGNSQFTGEVVSLGSNSNVRITGGSAGQVLSTDGTGALSWVPTGAANTAQTVTNNAQPNITSLGTLSSLNVTGNITSGNVYANSGTVRGSLLTGTLTTASQPNITSLGTLANLTVSGNAQFTGQLVNLGTVGNLRITGGSAGYVLTTDGVGGLSWASAGAATTAITVTGNAQPNITSLGTLNSLVVSGNASFTGPNVSLGAIANLKIAGGSSGFVLSTDGSGNLSWAPTGTANTAATVTTAAQPNITSVGTLTSLTVSGNITTTAGRFIGSGLGLTNVPGANVTGTVANATYATTAGSAATATSATTATTATTATSATSAGTASFATNAETSNRANVVLGSAQPNITSVGTLTSLAVSGSLTRGGQDVITLGDFTNSSGWTRLPNGLLMQYGTATAFRQTSTFINYPIAFSSFSVAVCSGSTASNFDGSQGAPGVINSTTTGFTTFFGTDGGGSAVTIRWIAIGY